MENHKVIIIGAGPAGLSAAIRLRELGFTDVVVLEREAEAGGIPRHCGHYGFGWESHKRLMTGPRYTARLLEAARGTEIRCSTTVLGFSLRNTLRVHAAKGIFDMAAKSVILATGTRESSRAAQLIGGQRMQGVMNTAMLQQLVYLKNEKPFSNPVIIGNEWVTFSALMTCNHAGIKPVGIFSEDRKFDTPWFFPLGGRIRYGVAAHRSCKLIAINGKDTVHSVEIEKNGKRNTIDCDGVILTGKFVPETALLDGRSIDVTRVGNVLGQVHTAGRCVVDARTVAEKIAKDLA